VEEEEADLVAAEEAAEVMQEVDFIIDDKFIFILIINF